MQEQSLEGTQKQGEFLNHMAFSSSPQQDPLTNYSHNYYLNDFRGECVCVCVCVCTVVGEIIQRATGDVQNASAGPTYNSQPIY
jgi:hypothetical protein